MENMAIHFVYAGWYYRSHGNRLRSSIIKAMKKYKIEKVMVTIIYMWRFNLITKEKMENYCNEKEDAKKSVDDDLEKLFEDIQLGKKPDEQVWTYFLPKLTEEEMELVANEDKTYFNEDTFYLKTFIWPNPDVDEDEMILSESDSKFVEGLGQRKTFTVDSTLSQDAETSTYQILMELAMNLPTLPPEEYLLTTENMFNSQDTPFPVNMKSTSTYQLNQNMTLTIGTIILPQPMNVPWWHRKISLEKAKEYNLYEGVFDEWKKKFEIESIYFISVDMQFFVLIASSMFPDWRWRLYIDVSYPMEWRNGCRIHKPSEKISLIWPWSEIIMVNKVIQKRFGLIDRII